MLLDKSYRYVRIKLKLCFCKIQRSNNLFLNKIENRLKNCDTDYNNYETSNSGVPSKMQKNRIIFR